MVHGSHLRTRKATLRARNTNMSKVEEAKVLQKT